MQHQPEFVIEADGNPLANAPKLADGAACRALQGWLRGSQEGKAVEAHFEEQLTQNPGLEGAEIRCYVGQLRHRIV
jgi:hypothetical protein